MSVFGVLVTYVWPQNDLNPGWRKSQMEQADKQFRILESALFDWARVDIHRYRRRDDEGKEIKYEMVGGKEE